MHVHRSSFCSTSTQQTDSIVTCPIDQTPFRKPAQKMTGKKQCTWQALQEHSIPRIVACPLSVWSTRRLSMMRQLCDLCSRLFAPWKHCFCLGFLEGKLWVDWGMNNMSYVLVTKLGKLAPCTSPVVLYRLAMDWRSKAEKSKRSSKMLVKQWSKHTKKIEKLDRAVQTSKVY